MPRIDEICREKLVSDVLEEKEGLTPLKDEFLPRLERHLCQQFGINLFWFRFAVTRTTDTQ